MRNLLICSTYVNYVYNIRVKKVDDDSNINDRLLTEYAEALFKKDGKEYEYTNRKMRRKPAYMSS
ncbi:MAG: hypothetical protein QW416_08895 [Candidatus Nitrosocaldaceae archaeon]